MGISAGHYILPLWFLLFAFFIAYSQRSQIGCLHTSAHDVALVRIYNTGLKCAARGSLEIQD